MTHTTRPTITPTANLAGADLRGADLSRAHLVDLDTRGARHLDLATLTDAIITDLITQITVSH